MYASFLYFWISRFAQFFRTCLALSFLARLTEVSRQPTRLPILYQRLGLI